MQVLYFGSSSGAVTSLAEKFLEVKFKLLFSFLNLITFLLPLLSVAI